MYCQKCGAELQEGAVYCAKCGTKQEVIIVQPKAKVKIKPLYCVIAGVVIAVVAVAAWIGNMVTKTVKLNDYVTVSFEGYNTRGKAYVTFDRDAFTEKYEKRIKLKEDNAWLTSFFYTPAELFLDELTYELDQKDSLTNGDEVVLTWAVDAEQLKKTYGLRVKTEDQTFTVADLGEIETFDPFADVEVSFAGIAPNGTAQILQYPVDNGLSYSLDKTYNLSNDETVTVSISYGWNSEDSYIDTYGRLPDSTEREYIVSGLDEYITAYEQIPANLLENMKSEAEDQVAAYVASSYNSESKLMDLQYAGYIFAGVKSDTEYWSFANDIFIIYKGIVSNEDDAFQDTEVYFPVEFRNLLKNNEGVNYSEYGGIQGYSYLGNTWYGTNGYTNPLNCYLELADHKKEDYNVTCGDGFERYDGYAIVSDLNSISDAYKTELEQTALSTILTYIEEEYNEESHCDDLEVVGEYLLVEKEQGNDLANQNELIIVYSGVVSNEDNAFETTSVYFPVGYRGVIALASGEYVSAVEDGIYGRSYLGDTWYSTNGYTDATTMFQELVTANRDNYKYEVSEGLKEFGE